MENSISAPLSGIQKPNPRSSEGTCDNFLVCGDKEEARPELVLEGGALARSVFTRPEIEPEPTQSARFPGAGPERSLVKRSGSRLRSVFSQARRDNESKAFRFPECRDRHFTFHCSLQGRKFNRAVID